MKTLHLYLTRQVLLTLLMTVAVFTFVLLLTNLLKEILTMLVNHQATPWILLKAITLLIPFVMAFALPMGMLTAALLVFGRFSADQELTAARASGVSLLSLITPVLLLSVILSAVCGLFNLEIGPRCRVAYKEMLYSVGIQSTANFVEEGRFMNFPGWVLYASEKKGNHLRDVRLYERDKDSIKRSISAEDGTFVIDPVARTLSVTLTNAVVVMRIRNETSDTNSASTTPNTRLREWQSTTADLWENPPVSLGTSDPSGQKPKLSDMTFLQLMAEIREQEEVGIDATPAQVQLHRQVAFSFACFGFTMIGIPLGVRAHRRETTIGIALALVLVLIYYSFIILAQAWEARPDRAPELIVWAPNFLFQAVGIVLLSRANRGD